MKRAWVAGGLKREDERIPEEKAWCVGAYWSGIAVSFFFSRSVQSDKNQSCGWLDRGELDALHELRATSTASEQSATRLRFERGRDKHIIVRSAQAIFSSNDDQRLAR